jgi:hypothetical protein
MWGASQYRGLSSGKPGNFWYQGGMSLSKSLAHAVVELAAPLFKNRIPEGQEKRAAGVAGYVAGPDRAPPPEVSEMVPLAQVTRMTATPPLAFVGDGLLARESTTLLILMVGGSSRTIQLPAGTKILALPGMLLVPPC